MRLFYALPLAEDDRARVEALARELGRREQRLRPLAAEGLHLTLRFLGERPARELAALQEVLSRPLPGPGRLRAEGLLGLPEAQGARVVALRVLPEPDLARLVRELTRRLAAAGYPPERRPFLPHVSLARARGEGVVPVPELPVPALELEVREVVLYESHLRPEGARYAALAAASLTPGGADVVW